MKIIEANKKLQAEWLEPDGFFWKLREGVLSEEGYQRLKEIFGNLEVPEGQVIDREFVSLVWFIPTFMRWQERSLKSKGNYNERYEHMYIILVQTIQDILGYP